MSIKSIVEKYPETIPVFANIGFKGLDNPAVLQKLEEQGITLEKAMMIKKEDVDAFIPMLQHAIASVEREDEGVKEASLMGLLPCPVRIPLLEGFEKYLADNKDIKVKYELKAAYSGLGWIKDEVIDKNDIDKLADMFISAGFDLFFDKDLMGKFKEQGIFKDMTGIEKYNTDFDNENIFWVDWREYDEDIVNYVNDELSETDQIEWKTIPSEKEGALDTVILKKDEKEAVIPYAEDAWDRDTTLKSIGKFINDKYKLCWFKPSLGGDTLGFVVIGNEDWEKLSAEFGEEKLKFLEEMSIVQEAVAKAFHAEKMNIELLGNGDAHVHWHLFPRKSGDMKDYGHNGRGPVWWVPWDEMSSEEYQPKGEALEQLVTQLKSFL